MTVRLSIAMATYNGAQFLETQLRSFLDQSRRPDQLVACDDGSSDETVAILEEFGRAAPFEVKVQRNPQNLGHEGNFGQAIALAEGDIILLADQDDRWDAGKLATVEQEFERHAEALLIVNDVRMTDGELNPTGPTLLGQLRSSGLIGRDNRGLLIGCGTSFRSSLKPLVSPVPLLDYGHDTWVNEFAAMLGAKRIIGRPLQDYRRHVSNASFTAMDGAARANPLTILRPSLGQDLTTTWQKRLDALAEMERRLSDFGRDAFSGLGIRRSFDEAMSELRSAQAALRRRMAVFRRGWAGRKLLAAEMLLRGDYRHFSGWRSFAKDVIR